MNFSVKKEAALKAAKGFFSTKTSRNFYKVFALNKDFLNEVCYHQELSDDEASQLVALREKYGDAYILHLDEVFDDPDVIHDLSCGDEILGIELDTPMRKFRFSAHFFDGEKRYSRGAMVEVTDEEYINLLALRLYDNHLNMSVLRHIDKELHEKILDDVEWQTASDDGFLMCPNPFLVTMDEVNEDAEAIIEEHQEFKEEGYRVY